GERRRTAGQHRRVPEHLADVEDIHHLVVMHKLHGTLTHDVDAGGDGPVLSEDHRSGVRSEHPRAGGQLLQLRRVRAREGLIPAKECCDVVHRVMTSETRGYSTTMPASILSRLTPADLLRERLIGGIDISPDGALIAYSERTVVTGRDRSSIWMVPFSGRRPRR